MISNKLTPSSNGLSHSENLSCERYKCKHKGGDEVEKSCQFILVRCKAGSMGELRELVFKKILDDTVPVFRFVEAPWCMVYDKNINSTLFCTERELLEELTLKNDFSCNAEWLEEMFEIYWNAIVVGHIEVCALLEN